MYVGSQAVFQSRPAMSWMVSRACACPSMHVLRERQSWIWIPTPCALASRPWPNLHATRTFACAVVIPKKKRRLLLRPEEYHTNYTRRSVPLSSLAHFQIHGRLDLVRTTSRSTTAYQAHALLFPGRDLPSEPSLLGPVVNATLIPRTILVHPPLGTVPFLLTMSILSLY